MTLPFPNAVWQARPRSGYSSDGRALADSEFFREDIPAITNALHAIGVTTTQGLTEFLAENNRLGLAKLDIQNTIGQLYAGFMRRDPPHPLMNGKVPAALVLSLGLEPADVYESILSGLSPATAGHWREIFVGARSSYPGVLLAPLPPAAPQPSPAAPRQPLWKNNARRRAATKPAVEPVAAVAVADSVSVDVVVEPAAAIADAVSADGAIDPIASVADAAVEVVPLAGKADGPRAHDIDGSVDVLLEALKPGLTGTMLLPSMAAKAVVSKVFWRQGANPDACDADGIPALILAAEAGYVGALTAIAESGADLDKPDGSATGVGNTAVMTAVLCEKTECYWELARRGADLDMANKNRQNVRSLPMSLRMRQVYERILDMETRGAIPDPELTPVARVVPEPKVHSVAKVPVNGKAVVPEVHNTDKPHSARPTNGHGGSRPAEGAQRPRSNGEDIIVGAPAAATAFAALVRKFARLLEDPGSREPVGSADSFRGTLMSSPSLAAVDYGRRWKMVDGLVSFYEGLRNPVDPCGNLEADAVMTMIMLKIPSEQVEESVGALRGQIIYTDPVRVRPLGRLLRDKRLFTLAAMNACLRQPLSPEKGEHLVKILKNRDPAALGAKENEWAMAALNEAINSKPLPPSTVPGRLPLSPAANQTARLEASAPH